MTIEEIKKTMKSRKITYEKLSQTSHIPLNTLKNIFCGKTQNPRIDTMQAIEKALGINNELPPGAFMLERKGFIPLVGQVVAGVPIESPEYLEGYITIDFPHPENYFALRVKGDSMINARIFPNDILIVHIQNYAENGDIVVASINGESTVKRYKTFGNSVFLMPENSNYEPIPITDDSNLYIFGKVVRIMTDI